MADNISVWKTYIDSVFQTHDSLHNFAEKHNLQDDACVVSRIQELINMPATTWRNAALERATPSTSAERVPQTSLIAGTEFDSLCEALTNFENEAIAMDPADDALLVSALERATSSTQSMSPTSAERAPQTSLIAATEFDSLCEALINFENEVVAMDAADNELLVCALETYENAQRTQNESISANIGETQSNPQDGGISDAVTSQQLSEISTTQPSSHSEEVNEMSHSYLNGSRDNDAAETSMDCTPEVGPSPSPPSSSLLYTDNETNQFSQGESELLNSQSSSVGRDMLGTSEGNINVEGQQLPSQLDESEEMSSSQPNTSRNQDQTETSMDYTPDVGPSPPPPSSPLSYTDNETNPFSQEESELLNSQSSSVGRDMLGRGEGNIDVEGQQLPSHLDESEVMSHSQPNTSRDQDPTETSMDCTPEVGRSPSPPSSPLSYTDTETNPFSQGGDEFLNSQSSLAREMWGGSDDIIDEVQESLPQSGNGNELPQNQLNTSQEPHAAEPLSPTPCPTEEKTAHDNTARVVTIFPKQNKDILLCMKSLEFQILEEVHKDLTRHKGIKWLVNLSASFIKVDCEQDEAETEVMFGGGTQIAFTEDDTTYYMPEVMQTIYTKFVDFEADGSGWMLQRVTKVDVWTLAYDPLTGSSYIELPEYIRLKHAVINIRNIDNKCILWSILAHIHPANHAQRVNNYTPFENELNMKGVSYPTPLSDVIKIEKNNNLSINIFGYDRQDGVVPLYRSRNPKENQINLMLIKQGEKSHYCLIRHFDRLMSDKTKHRTRAFYCFNCLHRFSRQQLLDDHKDLCHLQKAQKLMFPQKEKATKFKNIQKQLKMPFVIYADFESFTTKIDSCQVDPTTSSTTAYQKHEPSGFAYKVVCVDDTYTKDLVVSEKGLPNVVDEFFRCLLKEHEEIGNILSHVKEMIITPQEEREFQLAVDCHICRAPLGADRVRDHDHLSGKYRGPAHNECNLAFKYPKANVKEKGAFIVPVIFHNLRGYDSHLLMESIGKFHKRISCIPNNMERYISFSLGCLRFIDSCQFLNASLDKLVTNLADDGPHNFKHLCKEFPQPQQQTQLLRKGVYPYDYVDSAAKLEETILPPKEAFYSLLNQEGISEENYEYAQSIWQNFQCQSLQDYHDLYLKTDVLLLADVFEGFRDMAMEMYKLDPAHYYTSPGLSWDSMLRMTGVELQLLDDPDMYLMVESGIRGGVSTITKKYAKANNPYVPDYDASKPKNYLMYLDANNLYGWAMSQKLPVDEFDWMLQEELDHFDVTQIEDESETGYILEVDIEYPEEIHSHHSDLPVAPEKIGIEKEYLSPYTLHLKEKLGLRGAPKPKLIPNLSNKTKYVVHYRTLKQYIRLGLRVTKIHRAIRFRQSYWLRDYISLNTERRKQARNSFEKDFFKLMNNAIFGKMMENVRGRSNWELVSDAKRMRKIVAKPTFDRVVIFNENLSIAHCLKASILLDKPIYVGLAILDLSKTLMYTFHYEHIKEKYGNHAHLCFTDTDSLLYDIRTDDVYSDMAEDLDMYDTSDYPTEHRLHSNSNKKTIGKMKDETAGQPIEEFVGLRSKMYSIKYGRVEKKTAKGIKRSTIKHDLKHHMYKDVLFNEEVTHATMRLIRSTKHKLHSIVSRKIALSPYDDKRFVLDDKFSTRAHGHRENFTN